MEKKKTNERGITLISLVITIVVLLILAGVAISIAVDSDGLFGKAGEAANKWNTSIAEEETAVQNILSVMEEITSEPITIVVSEDSDTPTLASAIEKLDEVTQREVIISIETDRVEWETTGYHLDNPLIPSTNTTIKKLTITGKTKDVEFVATGEGCSPIGAANGATVIFKNLTFKDESVLPDDEAGGWEYSSMDFCGNLVFEDCDFVAAVMAKGGFSDSLNADFIECSFLSNISGRYAAWVSHGYATFTECEFGPGTRGIKTHEEYESDVQKIVIDNCVFQDLSEKPGIALGTLNSDTEITIQNSTFKNCKAGKQGLYIYETDTDVSTFDFTQTGNEVINDT